MDAIRALIRDIPDFPSKGILFKDLTPVLGDPRAFARVLAALEERVSDAGASKVVGIEARGLIFGAALAPRLGAGFVPVRKPGKLPAQTERVTYELEYGTDAVEMHVDAVEPGDRALVVDDLLATGGTARATRELVTRRGAEVAAFAFVVELGFLGGRDRLEGSDVHALITY